MRILLVEDDVFLIDLMKDCFSLYYKKNNIPIEISVAFNGKEALDLCKNFYFDFIISDIDMPVMRGDAFISELKKNYRDSYFKIYVNSGYLPNESMLGDKVDAYFTKPTKATILIDKMNLDYKSVSHAN
jgi:CheY-like chemotaxis protein